MTIKEVARQMYAGKECHDFEFDYLWNFGQTYRYKHLTVMAKWKRRATLKWLLTFAWLR